MRVSQKKLNIETRLAITLRTPGNDEALMAGYLRSEGIVSNREQFEIERLSEDRVVARLTAEAKFNPRLAQRNGAINASCGLCGKTHIEAVSRLREQLHEVKPVKYSADWHEIIAVGLKHRQKIFELTGGVHAAALFTAKGELIFCHEDIGRHNAVDKVIGEAVLQGMNTDGMVLWVSSRAGFELVQKAVMADIGMLIAVGAGTSLAVEAAEEFNLTLVTFFRDGTATVCHQGET